MSGGEYHEGGVTTKVLAQDVHTFEELPDKMQRLWREEYGESVNNELFLVVCTEGGDVFVFGENGRAFGVQAVSPGPGTAPSRWFTKIEYEIIDSPGEEPDENNEVRATFNLVGNDAVANADDESWIDDVAQELAALADRHKEE